MNDELMVTLFISASLVSLVFICRFVQRLVRLLRRILLKYRGQRATAVLTNIEGEFFRRGEFPKLGYSATAKWREEDNTPRSYKIITRGRRSGLRDHEENSEAEIYYNKRSAALVHDGMLTLVLGLLASVISFAVMAGILWFLSTGKLYEMIVRMLN